MTTQPSWLTHQPSDISTLDQLSAATAQMRRCAAQVADMAHGVPFLSCTSTSGIFGPVGDRLDQWIGTRRIAGCTHLANPIGTAGLLSRPGIVWCWDCTSTNERIILNEIDRNGGDHICWACRLPTDRGIALLISHGPTLIQGFVCPDCMTEMDDPKWTTQP